MNRSDDVDDDDRGKAQGKRDELERDILGEEIFDEFSERHDRLPSVLNSFQ